MTNSFSLTSVYLLNTNVANFYGVKQKKKKINKIKKKKRQPLSVDYQP